MLFLIFPIFMDSYLLALIIYVIYIIIIQMKKRTSQIKHSKQLINKKSVLQHNSIASQNKSVSLTNLQQNDCSIQTYSTLKNNIKWHQQNRNRNIDNENNHKIIQIEQKLSEFLVNNFKLLTNSKNWKNKNENTKTTQKYLNFMKLNQQIQKMSSFLLLFYNLVIDQGGMVQVISHNQLLQIVTKLISNHKLKSNIDQKIFLQMYKLFILPFELFQKNLLTMLQPINIESINYYSIQQFKLKSLHTSFQIGLEQTFIIKDFSSDTIFCNINQILNIQYLNMKYPNQMIKTQIQNPNLSGFDFLFNNTSNKSIDLTLSQFCLYLKNYESNLENLKNLYILNIIRKQFIILASDIPIFDKKQILQPINQSLTNFECLSILHYTDALSYSDSIISGYNFPKLYFLIKGSRIGAHQTYGSLSLVDINYGPDDLQWMILDAKYVPQFRQQILRQYHIDIHNFEKLWYKEYEELMMRNYPIKITVQKTGDLIYLSPGSLIWNRSLGNSLHCQWHRFSKTVFQIIECKKRQKINQSLNSLNKFPFKLLCVKLLNHQYSRNCLLSKQLEILIKYWKEQEQTIIIQDKYFFDVDILLKTKTDSESWCKICHREIFCYYQEHESNVVCIKCIKSFNQYKFIPFIYSKYSNSDLLRLINLSRNHRLQNYFLYQQQINNLCNGCFIGTVDQCKTKRVSTEIQRLVNEVQQRKLIKELNNKFPLLNSNKKQNKEQLNLIQIQVKQVKVQQNLCESKNQPFRQEKSSIQQQQIRQTQKLEQIIQPLYNNAKIDEQQLLNHQLTIQQHHKQKFEQIKEPEIGNFHQQKSINTQKLNQLQKQQQKNNRVVDCNNHNYKRKRYQNQQFNDNQSYKKFVHFLNTNGRDQMGINKRKQEQKDYQFQQQIRLQTPKKRQQKYYKQHYKFKKQVNRPNYFRKEGQKYNQPHQSKNHHEYYKIQNTTPRIQNKPKFYQKSYNYRDEKFDKYSQDSKYKRSYQQSFKH